MDSVESSPPILVLANACEPHIWPWYGHAANYLEFYKQCPQNRGTNKKRIKELEYHLKERNRYLGIHRNAAERLERDCDLLEKALRICRIEVPTAPSPSDG